jgi:YVTN family beta-propeller protein
VSCWFTLRSAVFAIVLAGTFCGTAVAQDIPAYTLTKTIALGAPDRWDYLTFDPEGGRVFIAHGDRVTVVDARSGTVLGQIEGFPGGTHGIAIVPTSGRGYTDDGLAGTVTSFDLKTLKRVQTIKAAKDADGLIFDPASGHVFAVNGGSGSVTVIDPSSDVAIATIHVGTDLEFAVVDGSGKLYIDGAEANDIVRVDTKTNKVDAHWPIPACTRPRGIAIDVASHRIFASCANSVLVVVNYDNGNVVATLPIGSKTDAAAFDPVRKRVFSSNGDGTLSVIGENGPNEFVRLGDVPTMPGARTMAIDPRSGRIFLVAADLVPNADTSDKRRPFLPIPGTAKLLILDPAN